MKFLEIPAKDEGQVHHINPKQITCVSRHITWKNEGREDGEDGDKMAYEGSYIRDSSGIGYSTLLSVEEVMLLLENFE